MSSQGILVEKSPSSSTTSGNDPSGNAYVAMVQQLKAKVFDVDLLQTIKDDHVISYEIKNLLKYLNNPYLPNSTFNLILEFESFLDQIAQNIKMKKESAKKIKQKIDVMSR